MLDINASPAPEESITLPLSFKLNLYSLLLYIKIAPFSPRVIVTNFAFSKLYNSILFFIFNLSSK